MDCKVGMLTRLTHPRIQDLDQDLAFAWRRDGIILVEDDVATLSRDGPGTLGFRNKSARGVVRLGDGHGVCSATATATTGSRSEDLCALIAYLWVPIMVQHNDTVSDVKAVGVVLVRTASDGDVERSETL